MDRYTLDTRNVKEYGTLDFNLGIGEDFATNLYQESLLGNDYIEKVKNENINKILDYEKHIFYPVYLTKGTKWQNGSYVKTINHVSGTEDMPYQIRVNGGDSNNIDDYTNDVNKIVFNLYLKKRYCDENGDYGDWEVKDESYWNRWAGWGDSIPTSYRKKLDDTLSTEYNGDLLGCLGFTDDDVFYQKNNLKKSFLRISIYDSPYRQSQKLLYYSTLFFDTNVLYKKFINLNNYQFVDGDTSRVYQYRYKTTSGDEKDIPDEDKLTATFTCTSKFDNSACSDGFYLYLFNTIVKTGQFTQLYMKVEFNNAKYGKSIPLIAPLGRVNKKRNGKVIRISSLQFPEDYEVTLNGTSNSYVDIKKLYEDMYIPIFVRYNNKKNRFEWYIASDNSANKNVQPDFDENKDTIVINLYEPKINRLKE